MHASVRPKHLWLQHNISNMNHKSAVLKQEADLTQIKLVDSKTDKHLEIQCAEGRERCY